MKHLASTLIAFLLPAAMLAQPQGPPINPLAGTFSVNWITYLGSTDTDELLCVRDMPDGGVVACGRTMSQFFPGMDSLDTAMGSYDMVIVRIDSSGQVMWTTMYGGQFYESANGMVVSDTCIYVVGVTNGTDCPMINAYQPLTGGSYDAIILRLGFDGAIQQSSYFGGFGAEMGYGIAMDSTGKIVIGGSSTSATLPMSAGNFQPGNGGANDCFITVLNDSFAPLWTTFYGGSSTEDVHQLTVTPLNKIVLIGGSFSLNFPCSPGAFQSGRLGNCDAYYVIFDMQGNREYATYYGGSGNEDCFGIAGDSAGNIYLGGHTSSMDFNTTGTIFQPMFAGINDAWIARFDSTGQPVFSTFFGGAMDDKTWSMELRDGHLYLSGVSQSSDLYMNTNVPQDSMWGASDGFIVKFDTTGNYVTSTYLGGSGADDMYGVTVNADTFITCVGVCYSNNFPVTAGCYQSNYVASGDGFVARYKLSETWTPNSTFENPRSENPNMVYPNPVSNELFIQSATMIESVFVMSADGKLIDCSSIVHGNSAQINTSALSSGLYFVMVESGCMISQMKFVIAR